MPHSALVVENSTVKSYSSGGLYGNRSTAPLEFSPRSSPDLETVQLPLTGVFADVDKFQKINEVPAAADGKWAAGSNFSGRYSLFGQHPRETC